MKEELWNKKKDIIFINIGIVMTACLLFTGCDMEHKEENRNEMETAMETENTQAEKEIQSSTVPMDKEAVPEGTKVTTVSPETEEEEITYECEFNIISVESEAIRRFLEGEGEAVLSESFLATCSKWDFEHLYEGTLDEILMGYCKDVSWTNEFPDIVVGARDIYFRDNEVFTYVWIEGVNTYAVLDMLLKEEEDGIKLCYQEEYGERTSSSFKDNGIMIIFENVNGNKHAHYYSYFDEKGDIYELYQFAGYSISTLDTSLMKEFDMEEGYLTEGEDVYIEEYYLDGRAYYTIDFADEDEVPEDKQEEIRKHIVDGGYVEDKVYVEGMVYMEKEEIDKKLAAYVSSLGIDPSVIQW